MVEKYKNHGYVKNIPNPNHLGQGFINELNDRISQLSMRDRILILEYVTGRTDGSELTEELAIIAAEVLEYKTIGIGLPRELDPQTWNLPQTR